MVLSMASLNFKKDFSLNAVGFIFIFIFSLFWMAISKELSFEAGQTKSGCVDEMCPGNRKAMDPVRRVLLLSAATWRENKKAIKCVILEDDIILVIYYLP